MIKISKRMIILSTFFVVGVFCDYSSVIMAAQTPTPKSRAKLSVIGSQPSGAQTPGKVKQPQVKWPEEGLLSDFEKSASSTSKLFQCPSFRESVIKVKGLYSAFQYVTSFIDYMKSEKEYRASDVKDRASYYKELQNKFGVHKQVESRINFDPDTIKLILSLLKKVREMYLSGMISNGKEPKHDLLIYSSLFNIFLVKLSENDKGEINKYLGYLGQFVSDFGKNSKYRSNLSFIVKLDDCVSIMLKKLNSRLELVHRVRVDPSLDEIKKTFVTREDVGELHRMLGGGKAQ